jgi:hypothetical protein
MSNIEDSIAWLRHCTVEYCASKDGMSEVVEDFDKVGKLG